MAPASARNVTIVPVGDVDEDLLEYLALSLAPAFGANVRVCSMHLSAAAAYSSSRQQYHSTQLLRQLHDLGRDHGEKILGVTNFDLFIPIFTFVFGEAQVGGPVALMSAHRLRQEFYGLPENPDLFFARAEKEATHELGHAFGLAHCRSFDCVMRFSNSVEDVDVKFADFCTLCDAKLRAQSNFTIAA
jgi:archaemetzincin